MCFDALVRMTRGMRVDDRDAARSAAEDASHTTLRRKLDDLLKRA